MHMCVTKPTRVRHGMCHVTDPLHMCPYLPTQVLQSESSCVPSLSITAHVYLTVLHS